jgi:DNA-directed RNA polymerase subunit K/omega
MEEDLDDVDFLETLEFNNEELYSKERKTPPLMWWNEKCIIISKRIKQLNNGMKTTIPEIVEREKIIKSYDIAIREFDLGKLPKYYLKRRLPNGTYELWSHEDFEFFPK